MALSWAWGACPTLTGESAKQRAPVVPSTRLHARTHALARVSCPCAPCPQTVAVRDPSSAQAKVYNNNVECVHCFACSAQLS